MGEHEALEPIGVKLLRELKEYHEFRSGKCTCGHSREVHKHYTHRSYCSSCGRNRYQTWYWFRKYRDVPKEMMP